MKRLIQNALTLLPIYPIVIIWFVISFRPQMFASVSGTLTTLGQISALVGSALMIWNIILSARYKFVEELFSGLNRVYLKHHLFGTVSFILLLFHPLLLAIPYLNISLKLFVSFLFPLPLWSNLPLRFGGIALLVMSVALIYTYFIRVKYHIWKSIHKYLFAAMLFSFPHFVLIPGMLSQNTPLKIYLLTLYIFGIYTYVTRTLLSRYFVRRYSYKIKSISKITGSTIELVLKPEEKQMQYKAGQFVFARVIAEGISKESHPFSISSASNSKNISIAIKLLGDYTKTLKKLDTSCKVILTGPFGKFLKTADKPEKIVFIAGGIGITPFMGYLRNIRNKKQIIDLVFSNKDTSDVPFFNEINRITRSNKNFKAHFVYSQKEGRLTADNIIAKTKPTQKTFVYICGPEKMMKDVRLGLMQKGFKDHQVQTEEFSFY